MRMIILLLSISFILLYSCTPNQLNETLENSYFQINDGKYDSHFPFQPVDSDIARIEKTVKLITNLTFYQAYDFSIESKIRYDDLNSKNIEEKYIKKYILELPASGTATIIAQHANKLALLTCHHIVSTSDTLINYHLDADEKSTPFIQNVAIKSRESINIIELPWLHNVRILASDKDLDVAILMATLNASRNVPIPVFSYKMGKAAELNWGTFVYIFGFPNGKKMISSAIVSNPNRDKLNGFMIDATMERGISGGIILAIRDDAPNFELVGMATAISAEREYILRPDDILKETEINFGRPYDGTIILDKRVKFNYGIIYAVSIEAIQDFLSDNKQILLEEGFNL
jgi:hypothetical protein